LSLIKLSLLVLLTFLVSGCGYIYGEDGLIKSRKYDYIEAKQSRTLKIPPSLTHKDKADFTHLPNIGEQGQKGLYGKQLGQAAPIQLLAVMENTRVDKTSVAPAVLVIDRLEFLWQTATKFLEEHNLATSILDKENRVIISRWLAIEEGGIWLGLDGSEEPDLIRAKYKISIVQGEIKGEHKLTVEQIASQVRLDDDEDWSDKRVTWQESADMMNLLLSYYDTRIRHQEARHQQQVMAGFKVELGQDAEGSAALLTSAKETLVWEKIPKVMRELSFTIIDKDTRQKTYFMEYHAPEQGFFASLFDGDTVQLPLEEGAFQMTVGESGELRSITFKDAQGIGIEADILVKLYPELSRLFGDRR
jgi:outer membrane protein assembly factor BamC